MAATGRCHPCLSTSCSDALALPASPAVEEPWPPITGASPRPKGRTRDQPGQILHHASGESHLDMAGFISLPLCLFLGGAEKAANRPESALVVRAIYRKGLSRCGLHNKEISHHRSHAP